MANTKKYFTEEEVIIARRNDRRKWRETHPIESRAVYLLSNYKRNDKRHNRGEGDLTSQWIIENIFTKPCVHCGKEGWQIIGCNRLDNSKPHTMDNVEPCCMDCNNELNYKERRKNN